MIISAEHLSKSVIVGTETLTILQDINLKIEKGESLSVVGVSGSGKTTLLGLLAGLDLPTKGRVIFNGVDLTLVNENKRAKMRASSVGFVFQNFQLLQNLTALENVMLPLELNNDKQAMNKAKELLADLGLMDRLHHYPKQLSGGEQQRVAIARAFAIRPRVLFADEPTANLDQNSAETIIRLLFDLNERFHTTLICVTHDPLIAKRCHQTLHLMGGRLIE